MFSLTTSQELAKNKILEKIIIGKKQIWFTAPTGAGKTFIIANLINNLVEYFYSEKIIFLFVSISSGSLQEQNYEKLEHYKKENLYKYKTQLIDSPSSKISNKNGSIDFEYNINIEDKTVYCMGTSSIKKNSILYERNIFNSFINSAFKNNYKIIYIKDEAHIGLKKDNKVNINKLENILFNKTFSNLGISATLPKEIEPDVILEERDVISDNLIKNDCYINYNIINSEVNYKELLVETLKQFKNLKKKYSKLNINPALLIQISSENQLNKVEEIKEITKIINNHNLKWCVWLSGNKPTSNSKAIKYSSKQEIRKHLSKNNSEIDVIIFKTALATGWDIPRACILLQIREVNSEILNEQTVGRIRRNPLILNFDDTFLKKYYIFSNYHKSSDKKKIFKVELKEKFKEEKFKYCRYEDLNIDNVTFNMEVNKELKELLWGYKKEIQKFILEKCNIFPWKVEIALLEDNKTYHQISYVEDIYNIIDFMILWEQKTKKIDFDLMSIIKKFSALNNFKLHKVCYFILKFNLINKIKMLISSIRINHIVNKNYKIMENRLPLVSYAFEAKKPFLIKEENVFKKWCYNKKEIHLDSKPEIVFLDELYKWCMKKNKDLFLFTRHYLSSSEIYYNYINETQYEKSIARSYPDFFVKYKEKIFVIEIKSENDDIKPEKTVSLFRAYKNISKVMNNQNYIFLIIKVDTFIKPYEFNIYKWSNGEIEEHLNQYTLENAFN